MRSAKIVCTLGPATSSPEQVRALVEAGMDVARFNLSHGVYADHEERYRAVRAAADAAGRAVGVLIDLQGPKIRVGTFADGPILLERGESFTITTEHVPGDRSAVSTTYAGWCARLRRSAAPSPARLRPGLLSGDNPGR